MNSGLAGIGIVSMAQLVKPEVGELSVLAGTFETALMGAMGWPFEDQVIDKVPNLAHTEAPIISASFLPLLIKVKKTAKEGALACMGIATSFLGGGCQLPYLLSN